MFFTFHESISDGVLNLDSLAICHLEDGDIIRANNEGGSIFTKVHQRDHGDGGNLVVGNDLRFRVDVNGDTVNLEGNGIISPGGLLGLTNEN